MVGRMLACCCKVKIFDVVNQSDICSTRFLYTLYIAVDGNFKLKGKECHLTDVELMPRCAAYVLESDYKAHLTNHIDQPEVNIDIAMTSINSLNILTDQYLQVTA
jgi:hypothetical protein